METILRYQIQLAQLKTPNLQPETILYYKHTPQVQNHNRFVENLSWQTQIPSENFNSLLDRARFDRIQSFQSGRSKK